MTDEGRWPPVYDFDDLAATIAELAADARIDARFYTLSLDRDLPPACQGDVIALRAPMAVIADDGQPVLTDDVDHWLLIGNTCDIDRPIDEVPWTQVVPLVDIGSVREIGLDKVARLRRYDAYRGFYVPPWPGGDDHHRLADLTRPGALHKGALPGTARVVARMQRHAWVLLHSCLVRFLARDDGRHA